MTRKWIEGLQMALSLAAVILLLAYALAGSWAGWQ